MLIWDLAPGTTHSRWFWKIGIGEYWGPRPNLFDDFHVFLENCKGNYISKNILWCCLYKQDWQVYFFYLWLINLHSCLGKLFLYCSWCCSSVRFSTFLKKSQTSRLGPRYHTFAFALAFVFAFAFAFGLVLGSNLFDQCLVFFDNCKGPF